MRQSLTVDLTHGRVQVSGWEVRLTNKEWDILRLLVMHAGTVLTHRAIMQAIWRAKGDVQYLRIYVRSMRRKLEPNPEQPRYILTEPASATACAPTTETGLAHGRDAPPPPLRGGSGGDGSAFSPDALGAFAESA
jgi:Transcriptional regulatory protein, C terminal